jgi:ATP-dependent DNA helicase PIF1
MIRAIGENKPLEGLVLEDELLEGEEPCPTHKRFTLTGIPAENVFNADGDPDAYDKAIEWLYPNGYSADHAAKNVVLATTNVNVDEWNNRIAALNPNPEHRPLLSSDSFTDVDDMNGHLKGMISDAVLEKYNSSDVPPHSLRLKVDDVCLIMRNLNVHDGVTNNTRVRILKITTKFIACQTISDHPIRVLLPRIRFNFRLPWGQSFMMTRLQFPLRRAFALSVHKSQGQTLERGLIDARGGFFAHGHLYVGMSRVTRYDKIALLVNCSQLYTDNCPQPSKQLFLHLKPFLQNIVYPEAISEIQALTDAYHAESLQHAPAAGVVGL